MSKWVWVDYDEMGRHYDCPECHSGIMVDEHLGHWTPEECPNCGADMREAEHETN